MNAARQDFLNEIFYSIVRTELRMTEAASLDVSAQRLVELHQLSRTPRGHLLHAASGAQTSRRTDCR
jgi:golgi-specific brefeldin A-resistance guanine nucleotide exchange factor 1